MDSGPKGLRHFLYILAIELSGVDAPPYCVAKIIETKFPGLRLVLLRNLFGLNKCNYIVVWIINSELHVRPQASL